jgi:predicted AlkP superfamily phosphohydrolase/phosphomutase
MENYPWDFFITLFSATDFVQHTFWKYMDRAHPQFDEAGAKKYGHVILDTYQRIDRHIGRILEKLDGDTTVILMSDHGAGPLHKVVNLNRWLEKEGWLTFTGAAQEGGSSGIGASTKRALLQLAQHSSMLVKRTPPNVKGRLKKLFPGLSGKVESIFLSSTIDWAHTKAFSLGAYGNIWINLKGREPQGVVEAGAAFKELCEQISERLLSLRDPDTGRRVVEKVYRREELYHGPFADRAPDLIVRWEDYAYYSRQRFGEREQSVFQTHLTRPLSSIEMNGYHRLNGIFIMKGKDTPAGKEIQGAQILDVAPTILYLLGVPVPEDMDGKVLMDALGQSYLDSHPVTYEGPELGGPVSDREKTFSEEEEEIVKERLRGLGYL